MVHARSRSGGHFAQFNLGVCYERGTGVATDAREAVKWYTRAAEAGHTIAQNNVGWCYANGEGVVRDFAAARTWWRRAAAAGDADAANGLAEINALYALS